MINKFLIKADQTIKNTMQLINRNAHRCLVVIEVGQWNEFKKGIDFL